MRNYVAKPEEIRLFDHAVPGQYPTPEDLAELQRKWIGPDRIRTTLTRLALEWNAFQPYRRTNPLYLLLLIISRVDWDPRKPSFLKCQLALPQVHTLLGVHKNTILRAKKTLLDTGWIRIRKTDTYSIYEVAITVSIPAHIFRSAPLFSEQEYHVFQTNFFGSYYYCSKTNRLPPALSQFMESLFGRQHNHSPLYNYGDHAIPQRAALSELG